MQKNLYECTVNLELCVKDQGISAWVDTVEYKKENENCYKRSYAESCRQIPFRAEPVYLFVKAPDIF